MFCVDGFKKRKINLKLQQYVLFEFTLLNLLSPNCNYFTILRQYFNIFFNTVTIKVHQMKFEFQFICRIYVRNINDHNDRAVRELNPLFYPQQRDWNKVRCPFDWEDILLTANIDRPSVLLQLVRKSWMSFKNLHIDCITTAQVQWNTKQVFNSNTDIFNMR